MAAAVFVSSCSPPRARNVEEYPEIFPDYTFVTVPQTIAPLNFEVTGADRIYVTASNGTESLTARGKYAGFRLGAWLKLLDGAQTIVVTVKASVDGDWVEYKPFDIYVSNDPIDATIVYRKIDPGYELYARMGIYQRDLDSFRERVVFENTRSNPGCVNCHSFAAGDPNTAQMHFRGTNGGTLIKHDGSQNVYNMANPLTLGTVYPYWHPGGRYLAYSVNDIRQSFHNIPSKVLEVYDLASDIVVFDTFEEKILVYPELQDSTRFETFPAFSPDGRTLYFCSAPADADFSRIRYDLCCVGFDPETGRLEGEIRTLWSAEDKSAALPRPSYDGKQLLFSVADYGNFLIWHQETDLYVMDLESGEVHPAEALNSSDTESYHSWSSDSKWVVFSSRRIDGRYTRPYIAYSYGDGTFGKPFQLPQRSPRSDLLMLQSYNIPEFCTAPFEIDRRAVWNPERKKIQAEKTQ